MQHTFLKQTVLILVHAVTSLNSLPTWDQYAIIQTLQRTTRMCCFEISLRSKRGGSSAAPYLHESPRRHGVSALLASAPCSTAPHNPLSAAPLEPSLENLEGKTQSILLIFSIQARFHVVFQEVIIHRKFITLSVVITSPLKHTMAFKKCFTVT